MLTTKEAIEMVVAGYATKLTSPTFSDSEIYFYDIEGNKIGEGYSGIGEVEVCIKDTVFRGQDAYTIIKSAKIKKVTKNI